MHVKGASAREVVRRQYFLVMASAMAVTVFVGFAPSFYLRSLYEPDRELSVLLHVHGIVFSTWIILLLTQTLLIARGAAHTRRTLGWISVAIAPVMVILVLAATIEQMRRTPPVPAPIAIALTVFDIVTFAIFVSVAVHSRKRPEWHKRFVLSATIVLMGAPIFRIILPHLRDLPLSNILLLQFALTDLFLAVSLGFDVLTRRRIHTANYWIVALVLLEQGTQVILIDWPPWVAFTQAIGRMVI